PDGLAYHTAFVAEEEERAIVRCIERLAFEPVRMRGGVGKRETIHFGWAYDYEGWRIREAPPPPPALEPLLARCAAAAGVARDILQQVMVARYPTGATIGWHRDAPMFGSPVIGVSFLSACEMRFRRALGPRGEAARRKFDTYALLLEPRSLYILDGAARSQWQHSIPKTAELRYSITMRTLRR
ncbi:MAG TPA: alpha-ketoglutarate-dependent dioxygenase AlkB, partial [Thermoanaerobaculia bacterium]|nr:alpha-ketoglutarate-dependent dioxygenase AlkB [Thermoanaerobaculia bacterium]